MGNHLLRMRVEMGMGRYVAACNTGRASVTAGVIIVCSFKDWKVVGEGVVIIGTLGSGTLGDGTDSGAIVDIWTVGLVM